MSQPASQTIAAGAAGAAGAAASATMPVGRRRQEHTNFIPAFLQTVAAYSARSRSGAHTTPFCRTRRATTDETRCAISEFFSRVRFLAATAASTRGANQLVDRRRRTGGARYCCVFFALGDERPTHERMLINQFTRCARRNRRRCGNASRCSIGGTRARKIRDEFSCYIPSLRRACWCR